MAIKNERKYISGNASEDFLKNKLKEGYDRFMNEADDEDQDLDGLDSDLEGDEGMGDEDPDLDGLEGGDEDFDDSGLGEDDTDLEDEQVNPLDDLNDNEMDQVNSWIDEMLGDSLSQVETDGDMSLDTETPSEDLDPMGEEQYVHDDMPMTVDELNNIIDSDEPLNALETELAGLAKDEYENGDEVPGEDENMDLEGMDDGTEDEPAYIDETSEENNDLDEAEDPMKGIDKYFEQGYEGEDTKDDLTEEVELATDNKSMGLKKVPAGLNDKKLPGVKPTPGSRSTESFAADQKGIVAEGIHKSKMLVKAAAIIDKQRNDLKESKKIISNLKLENYKLIKTNGILSVAGDKFSKEVRNKISEGFDKCKDIETINKFYSKITEQIKLNDKPSLNQLVTSKKTNVSVIKESKNPSEQKQKISLEQQRKNMLMGLDTEDDVYFSA